MVGLIAQHWLPLGEPLTPALLDWGQLLLLDGCGEQGRTWGLICGGDLLSELLANIASS